MIDFVTDTYSDVSIETLKDKDDTFLIKGPKTKNPRNWKKFFTNGKNKEKLVNILHIEWTQDKYAHYYQGRNLYLNANTSKKCTWFTTGDGLTIKHTSQEDLFSTQAEARY